MNKHRPSQTSQGFFTPKQRNDEGDRRCRFCGERGLRWTQTRDGKWRLVDHRGWLHVCQQYIEAREDSGSTERIGQSAEEN
jgi:hypothetical protein